MRHLAKGSKKEHDRCGKYPTEKDSLTIATGEGNFNMCFNMAWNMAWNVILI